MGPAAEAGLYTTSGALASRVAGALVRRGRAPHIPTAQAIRLRKPEWFGHTADPRMSLKEDMPCELLI
jgi:hypothetical protein